MPCRSPVEPSIHCKAAIHKRPRWTFYRGNFMGQCAGEEHDLVLPRDNHPVICRGGVHPVLLTSVINPEFSAAERLRFSVQEINKGDLSSGDFSLAIVAVPAEEVAVIAGGDLCFHTRDGECLPAKFLEHARKISPRRSEEHT